MKYLGILILAIGVAICASFGAKLTPQMETHLTRTGSASFHAKGEKAAFDAYCKAREEAKLASADGCLTEQEKKAAAEAAKQKQAEAKDQPAAETKKPTLEELVAKGQAELKGLEASTEALPTEVAKARAAWLKKKQAAIMPKATGALEKPPNPGGRLSQWFADSGVVFLVGLVLVVGGAVLSRIAIQKEAAGGEKKPAEGPYRENAEKAEPAGVAALLEAMQREVAELSKDMLEHGHPSSEDVVRFKERIETVQLERLEALVAAKGELQARYGLGAYAEIFGPLSGAERRLNRAWSALVDDHFPEAKASVERAAQELVTAHEALNKAQAEG